MISIGAALSSRQEKKSAIETQRKSQKEAQTEAKTAIPNLEMEPGKRLFKMGHYPAQYVDGHGVTKVPKCFMASNLKADHKSPLMVFLGVHLWIQLEAPSAPGKDIYNFSITFLAEALNVAPKTLSTALRGLEKAGLLTVDVLGRGSVLTQISFTSKAIHSVEDDGYFMVDTYFWNNVMMDFLLPSGMSYKTILTYLAIERQTLALGETTCEFKTYMANKWTGVNIRQIQRDMRVLADHQLLDFHLYFNRFYVTIRRPWITQKDVFMGRRVGDAFMAAKPVIASGMVVKVQEHDAQADIQEEVTAPVAKAEKTIFDMSSEISVNHPSQRKLTYNINTKLKIKNKNQSIPASTEPKTITPSEVKQTTESDRSISFNFLGKDTSRDTGKEKDIRGVAFQLKKLGIINISASALVEIMEKHGDTRGKPIKNKIAYFIADTTPDGDGNCRNLVITQYLTEKEENQRAREERDQQRVLAEQRKEKQKLENQNNEILHTVLKNKNHPSYQELLPLAQETCLVLGKERFVELRMQELLLQKIAKGDLTLEKALDGRKNLKQAFEEKEEAGLTLPPRFRTVESIRFCIN